MVSCSPHRGYCATTQQRRAVSTCVRKESAAADVQTGSGAGSGSRSETVCDGVVVTSQANFLRVVVNELSPAQQLERQAQLRAAVARAEKAGATDDVAKLTNQMQDNGPYEVLCIVRALLKKIKQRVLVVRPHLLLLIVASCDVASFQSEPYNLLL